MLWRLLSLKTVPLHALGIVCVAFSLTGLVVSCSQAVANECPTGKEITDSAMKGVVAIYWSNTQSNNMPLGTGFFITTDGYVLTASHVLDRHTNALKGLTFKILLLKDKELRDKDKFIDAQIISRNADLDLAVLKTVNMSDAAVSEIQPLSLKIGSSDKNLTVIGHPSGDHPDLFHCEAVTVKEKDDNGLESIVETLDSGYSGGPVIDANGSVVAITLQQGVLSSGSDLRRVDTIREFLEANDIVESGKGQEKHLSLSSLATIEKVAALESQLNILKKEIETKQFVIEDMKKKLVHWAVKVCEIQRKPGVLVTQHRLVIQFDKSSKLPDPTTDHKFEAQMTPIMTGETASEAQSRDLVVPMSVTFVGQKWSADPLDDVVAVHLRSYNEKKHPSVKLDINNIDSFAIALEPPDGNDDLQYLGFEEERVKLNGGGKCDPPDDSLPQAATTSQ